MDPVRVAIVTLALSLVLTIALLLSARLPARARSAAVPFGLVVPFAVLFWTQEGAPSWPPRQQWHSVVPVALLVAAASIAPALASPSVRSSAGRFALLPLTAAIVLFVALRTPSVGPLRPSHIAAVGLIMAGPFAVALAARSRGLALPAALAFVAIALAGMLFASGFAKAAFVTSGLAVGLAATALAAWRTDCEIGAGGGVVALSLLATMAAVGFAYADESRPPFPQWLWVVPVLAPLGAWFAEWPSLARRPMVAAAIRFAVPTVLAAAALVAALAVAPSGGSMDADPYTGHQG